MKSFLIYDEKGDFAMCSHVTSLQRTISPLSLSDGGAKKARRHNNNSSRSKGNMHSKRGNQTCRLTRVNEVSIRELRMTSRHPFVIANIQMAFPWVCT